MEDFSYFDTQQFQKGETHTFGIIVRSKIK